jgi:predicted Fe-Mo cluster-binding NifX family protein
MRVCVPTDSPGGPASPVADSFQESDLLDFYELDTQGRFVLSVQIPNCAGTCKDNVETVVRRGAEVVIVKTMSPSSVNRFMGAGVTVYRAHDGPSKISLAAMHNGELALLLKTKS